MEEESNDFQLLCFLKKEKGKEGREEKVEMHKQKKNKNPTPPFPSLSFLLPFHLKGNKRQKTNLTSTTQRSLGVTRVNFFSSSPSTSKVGKEKVVIWVRSLLLLLVVV